MLYRIQSKQQEKRKRKEKELKSKEQHHTVQTFTTQVNP